MHASHSLFSIPHPRFSMLSDFKVTGVWRDCFEGASYFDAHLDGYVSRFNSRCSDGHGYVDTYELAVKLNISADYRLHTVYTH